MTMKPSSYFAVLLLLIGVLVIIVSLTTMRYLESKILPIAMSSIISFLAAVQLRTEIRQKNESHTSTKDVQSDDEEIRGHFCIAALWVVGATFSVYLLGYFSAIALLVLSYLKHRRRSWVIAITMAGITTVLIYCIFELGLDFTLYRGLIYEVIISR